MAERYTASRQRPRYVPALHPMAPVVHGVVEKLRDGSAPEHGRMPVGARLEHNATEIAGLDGEVGAYIAVVLLEWPCGGHVEREHAGLEASAGAVHFGAMGLAAVVEPRLDP